MALAAIAAIKTILDFKLKTLVITAATHVMRPPDAARTLRVAAPPERHWKTPPRG
jgi:hypothetical protein